MKTWFALFALVGTSIPAVPVLALDTPLATEVVTADDVSRMGLGVTIGFQDILALAPSTSPTPTFNGTTSASVLTIGATYRHRLGADSNWFLDAGLHYGSGGSNLEDTGPIPFEQTESVSAVFGNAGLGYILPLTKKTSIYGSGRLFYSSSTATFEVPSGEFEGESFNVYGFEPAAGCSHRMNRLTYFGEFYNQFGWGSGEVGDVTYKSTIKQSCWRGGLLFNF